VQIKYFAYLLDDVRPWDTPIGAFDILEDALQTTREFFDKRSQENPAVKYTWMIDTYINGEPSWRRTSVDENPTAIIKTY
jgi:hypothetical protein